jgi:hypothetical protein
LLEFGASTCLTLPKSKPCSLIPILASPTDFHALIKGFFGDGLESLCCPILHGGHKVTSHLEEGRFTGYMNPPRYMNFIGTIGGVFSGANLPVDHVDNII